MKVPTDVFLCSISLQKVYYFACNRIDSPEPHYWICLQRTPDDVLVLSCCTSQVDTVERYIKYLKFLPETFVYISPKDSSNPFRKDTFVNCNNCQLFTVEEFRILYDSDRIDFSGEISEIYFQQILDGVLSSPLVDGETKSLLPKSII